MIQALTTNHVQPNGQTYSAAAWENRLAYSRTYHRLKRELDVEWRERANAKDRARYRKRCGHPDHKSKVRARHLWRRYGLTLDDFETLWRNQEGRCALCHRPLRRGRRQTCVDHDHDTGRVRGLLCILCNQSLGFYE